jgi:hypothetical protein
MIGFGLGCVLVFFMFNDRLTVLTAWLPNNRVLLRFQLTEAAYTDKALCQLECFDLDTADVSFMKREGDVLFRESETHVEPKVYRVEARINDRLVRMSFLADDSVSTLAEVEVPLVKVFCPCK